MPECTTKTCVRRHQPHDNYCPGCGVPVAEDAIETEQ